MLNKTIKTVFKVTKNAVYSEKQSPIKYRKGMNAIMSCMLPVSGVNYEFSTFNGHDAIWAIPQKISSDKVILYFHGGAYSHGAVKGYKNLLGRIAKYAECKLFAADYRLAPEHTFPAASDDALATYLHLINSGIDAKNIVLVGDSAGGGLVFATLLQIKEKGLAMPASAVCLSPWLDLDNNDAEALVYEKNDPFIKVRDVKRWGKFYAGDQIRNPLVSPIYATDFTGFPKMYIQVGTAETLLIESRKMNSILKKNGVDVQLDEFDEMMHVFQALAGVLPKATLAVKKIGEFVKSS